MHVSERCFGNLRFFENILILIREFSGMVKTVNGSAKEYLDVNSIINVLILKDEMKKLTFG